MKQLLLGIVCILALSACGGGGSNSGGSQAPVLLVQAGVYSGSQTLTIVIDGVMRDPATSDLELTVAGPEVIIAYRQFSGSSAIGASQEFLIPTGNFRLPTGTANVFCQTNLTFAGRFSGNTATGTVEGPVTCPNDSRSIRFTGTFTVSLNSAAKRSVIEPVITFDLDN